MHTPQSPDAPLHSMLQKALIHTLHMSETGGFISPEPDLDKIAIPMTM